MNKNQFVQIELTTSSGDLFIINGNVLLSASWYARDDLQMDNPTKPLSLNTDIASAEVIYAGGSL